MSSKNDQESYLLDTSALLTWLEGEAGTERVRELLQRNVAILPWASLLEVYYISRQEQGEIIALQRYAALKLLPVTVLWEVTEPILLTAGKLKAAHKLSFADAVIAASAIESSAILVHKDPEFAQLSNQLPQELLPFKT